MSDRDPSPCPFCGCEAEIIRGVVYCRGPNDCASASPEDWERVATATEAAEAARSQLAVAVEALEEIARYGEDLDEKRARVALKKIESLRAAKEGR